MSSKFKKMYHEPEQKWYKEIVAKKQPPLPENPSGTQLQNHEAIRRHRISARGRFENGQPLITTYFFPLDQEKKVTLRQMNGGQHVLPELIPASRIDHAYKNPTKNGPEVLKSEWHFEVAYQSKQGYQVRQHQRRAKGTGDVKPTVSIATKMNPKAGQSGMNKVTGPPIAESVVIVLSSDSEGDEDVKFTPKLKKLKK